MATYETDAIVLRTIRYSEADNIIALLTKQRGRVSAIAKGARKAKSRLGGRLQPGVHVRLTLHEGRGDLHAVRGASLIEPNAGLWADSYRLLAAGALLETTLRALPEDDPYDDVYNLTIRAVSLLAQATPASTAPRLDPLVLSYRAKLLVAVGLVPQLGSCVSCGSRGALTAFSAHQGGTLCEDCGGGQAVSGAAVDVFRQLLARPMADAAPVAPGIAEELENLIGSVLREHLGVELRSAAQH